MKAFLKNNRVFLALILVSIFAGFASAQSTADFPFDGTELDKLKPILNKLIVAGVGFIVVFAGIKIFRRGANRAT